MRVRRLGWAGIEVESQGESVVVDHVLGWKSIEPYVGPPLTPLLEIEKPGSSLAAFVTHLHTDHTDAQTIASDLTDGASLHRPAVMEGEPLETGGVAAAEVELAEAGVDQVLMDEWQTIEAGPFTATAVPAVDGFGDPQISWVIEADGKRIIHTGDTIFHGSWWLIQMRFGPFDAAFLPVNGALTSFPHRQPPESSARSAWCRSTTTASTSRRSTNRRRTSSVGFRTRSTARAARVWSSWPRARPSTSSRRHFL